MCCCNGTHMQQFGSAKLAFLFCGWIFWELSSAYLWGILLFLFFVAAAAFREGGGTAIGSFKSSMCVKLILLQPLNLRFLARQLVAHLLLV